MTMRNRILPLGLVGIVSLHSGITLANDGGVSSAVKNYTYKDGEPYGLSQVYSVDAPDNGFLPYYIFVKLGVNNAYPFVFNREGVPGKDEPYSRCNVALKANDKYLIPDRAYKSGYAEDSESCIGVDRLQLIKGSKDIKWYVADTFYQSEGNSPDKTGEVYFYSGGSFCFSQRLSLKLAANKVSMRDLKSITLEDSDFKECAK